ncbi:TonB-dependent receptor [Methylophaga pinxianii]|uniref:TonB-dependent receptor n=1 Tax=Methylophaga pinxianii TaxID=2881052 RepID=UPI001CF58BAC|nr:TonB-dependent siderophore receptor [Methylophaga pinxianii]MCB2427866.1 TonB-dependent siderophore receptor [Methylophaga pinxianii]UPH44656.1 TonB-dependent siderophore receptor [Methylophaga pinxianii]
MATGIRRTRNFKLKPIVSAITLAFGSAAYAEESVNLPRVEVQAQEEGAYKIDKSANRKFTADLIDMPKSVTVISEQVIQDSGSQTFSEALRMTPGITLGGGEGGIAIGDRPFIRGFDAFASIYVDGVRDIGSQTREIFAIEQMEILKGPSGAFDGRGSAGGSINLVTKQAREGDFLSGSVGFGTDSYRRATIDGNTMLGDNAAFRMVGMVHDADVAGRDEVEVKRWGMMPSLTLGLNSPTSATVSWYHLETDDTPDWGLPYIQDADGLPQGSPVGNEDKWYGVNGRDFMETESDIATLTISHDFNERVRLTNTTRYGLTTNEYFVQRPNVSSAQFASGLINRANTRDRGNRTETITNLTDLSLAFDTGFIKHTLNTGFEISREENRNRGFNGGGIIGGNLTSIDDPDNDVAYNPVLRDNFAGTEAETVNRSVYVFDTMELSEKWLLNAGIRYDDYQTEYDRSNSTTGAPIETLENDKDFFNYQLGLVYKIQPDLNVYAAYATSSSPVGLSLGDFEYAGGQLVSETEDLDPERSKTFEIGTKWNVMENLELTAAVFHTRKTNARVTTGNTISNAGEAEVNGFELSFAGQITDRWNVFGGYTYLDAKQTKEGTDPDLNQFGAAGTEGKQLPGVARQSASIWSTYRVLDDLTLGGGAFFMDKVYANPGNTGHIPSYVRWDAMAKYDINQNLDLQLNIQNLTDERYFSATYFRHYAVMAPGRSAFLTLNFNY